MVAIHSGAQRPTAIYAYYTGIIYAICSCLVSVNQLSGQISRGAGLGSDA